MAHRFYPEHALFLQSVKKFVDTELTPGKISEWERADRFPDELFKKLGDQGFLGILLPEEYGGIGGDYRLAAAWCEQFGEASSVGLTVAVNMHSLVISYALARFGSATSKKKWLAQAIQGNVIGAYAFTEPGAGSDLASLRTKAEFKSGRWLLNGSKTFITNGARADFILVLARTDPQAGYKGFTTFVVDTSLPGFKVQRTLDKVGWRCSDTAELHFDNVSLTPEDVLGTVGEGWIQASNSLNWERMMLSLTTLGACRACLRGTLRYARERKAFGQPIIEFGAVAAMLEEMRLRLLQGEAFTHHALTLFCAGKECRAEVAGAKKQLCDDAVWLADRAIQIHGGYGYTKEFLPERWWRDLRLMPIGGGTSEIMGNIVAKQLGLF